MEAAVAAGKGSPGAAGRDAGWNKPLEVFAEQKLRSREHGMDAMFPAAQGIAAEIPEARRDGGLRNWSGKPGPAAGRMRPPQGDSDSYAGILPGPPYSPRIKIRLSYGDELNGMLS
jgi:hypothetical protein